MILFLIPKQLQQRKTQKTRYQKINYLQIICIKSYTLIKVKILNWHRLEVQLASSIPQKLKQYELHFYRQKNAMLYTELNFARIWSSQANPTPVFHLKSLAI